MRSKLAEGAAGCRFPEVIPGVANYLLAHLPDSGCDAAAVASGADGGIVLRDAQRMGTGLGTHALHLAVKDRATDLRDCGDPVARHAQP